MKPNFVTAASVISRFSSPAWIKTSISWHGAYSFEGAPVSNSFCSPGMFKQNQCAPGPFYLTLPSSGIEEEYPLSCCSHPLGQHPPEDTVCMLTPFLKTRPGIHVLVDILVGPCHICMICLCCFNLGCPFMCSFNDFFLDFVRHSLVNEAAVIKLIALTPYYSTIVDCQYSFNSR